MTFGVLVVSHGSPRTLAQCLDALIGQFSPRDIVVVETSPRPPEPRLGVRMAHEPDAASLPAVRGAYWDRLSADCIGLLEGRTIPTADWRERMAEAHEASPDVDVVGGPLRPTFGARGFRAGQFLAEYSAFLPGLGGGRLCDANLSYKRRTLVALAERMRGGEWATTLHEGLRAAWADAEAVVDLTEMRAADAFRQRFHYGRGYAADRVRLQGASRLRALATPLLPVVLSARAAREAARAGRADLARGGWPYLAALEAAWSLGEAAGYVAGAPRQRRLF